MDKILDDIKDKIEDIVDSNIKTIPWEGEQIDRREMIEDIISFLKQNYEIKKI